MQKIFRLRQEIQQCEICAASLPLGPRPIVQFSTQAKILIVGQAPGTAVHKSGIPWNDPSGERLRDWLNIDKTIFYNEQLIAIVPMGFCYPGKGTSGDLPPRPECAAQWHSQILQQLPNIQLTLLIGQYAQKYYLPNKPKTLTDTVKNYAEYLPTYMPLPHPSPRNNIWLKKNPWFSNTLLPELKSHIASILFN